MSGIVERPGQKSKHLFKLLTPLTYSVGALEGNS